MVPIVVPHFIHTTPLAPMASSNEKCLARACSESNVKLISFGFGFMGGINELPQKIQIAEEEKI